MTLGIILVGLFILIGEGFGKCIGCTREGDGSFLLFVTILFWFGLICFLKSLF